MRYFVFFLTLIANAVHADTLWLNNGDQLSGRVLYLDYGSVAFHAEHIGRINISVRNIRTLESNHLFHIKVGQKTTLKRSHLHAGEPGMIMLDDQLVIALRDIDSLARLRDDIDRWHWDGNLDLAIHLKQEEHREEFEANTKLDTRVFNQMWRHNLKGEIEKKSENNKRKDNNYEVTYDLDRFLTERWFARAHGRQHRDYLGNNTTENELGAGLGYQFWDNVQGRFSLTTQLSRLNYRIHYENENGELRADLDVDIAGLEWDFQQQVGVHGLELFSKGTASYPYQNPNIDLKLVAPDGTSVKLNNLRLVDFGLMGSVESGIRYHVTDWIHLSFRHEFEYTAIDPKSEIKRRFFLGVGVSW